VNYLTIKLACGAIATIGLYTMLYRENKVYRVFEHMFLGLASGYSVVAIWTDVLKSSWWDKMVGSATSTGEPATMGFWPYALLLPIGLMGYFVFSKKHNWVSRIPIGILIGLYSGQQFQAWLDQYGGQIVGTFKPVVPNNWTFFAPYVDPQNLQQVSDVKHTVYISTALSNLIFVFTVLSVVSYFIFSFEPKPGSRISRFWTGMASSGRWLLMIGFGALFGTTVMMRFALLIDRMYYVWVEFLYKAILHH
jgi:hypothetical protein